MLKRLNLHLSYLCNLSCSYCFLTDEQRHSDATFCKWDSLLHMLGQLDLADDLIVNLASGELSLRPKLIAEACKWLKKIERTKETHLHFGLYTNGTNIDSIIELIEDGILDVNETSLSWDGLASRWTRNKNYYCPPLIESDYMKIIDKISASPIARNMNVRTAITREFLERDVYIESLEYLAHAGVKNWEYYFIMDNDDYRDLEIQDKFEVFIDYLYKIRGDLSVFNLDHIESHYAKKSAIRDKSWCSNKTMKSIDISPDGHIFPCGLFSLKGKYAYDGNEDISLNDPIDTIKKSVDEMSCKECKESTSCLSYKECKYTHCVECNRIPKFRKGNTDEYRFAQLCGMRKIEYDSYMKRVNKNV